MHTTNPRHWPARAAGACVLSAGLLLAACELDRPGEPSIPSTSSAPVAARSDAPPPAPDSLTAEEAMRLAIRTRHPELVTAGVEGNEAVVWMLTNSRGEIEGSVLETDPPEPVATSPDQLERLFPAQEWKERWMADLTNGAGARVFEPGEIGPDRVTLVWWERAIEGAPTGPFEFQRERPEWAATREARRAQIERHHPGVLEAGLPEGEMLWFLMDEEDRVVKTGRGLPATTSDEIRMWLEAQSPTGEIQPRIIGGTTARMTTATSRRSGRPSSRTETLRSRGLSALPRSWEGAAGVSLRAHPY